ncbi:hypothetical protein PM082_015617 [Marasmius tenuissimus]|nr:hypothetical protein PM082_015617 [Marasmius tenuissimus]
MLFGVFWKIRFQRRATLFDRSFPEGRLQDRRLASPVILTPYFALRVCDDAKVTNGFGFNYIDMDSLSKMLNVLDAAEYVALSSRCTDSRSTAESDAALPHDVSFSTKIRPIPIIITRARRGMDGDLLKRRIFFAFAVRGKEQSVPSSWDISTVKSSHEERINRESETASSDLFVRALVYLISSFPARSRTNCNQYGCAATRAYLAYRDEAFLDIAEDYWLSNRTLTLSDEDVESRSSPAKSNINATTSLSCSKPGSEYTLAGGTFYSAYDNDPLAISIGATAHYLTLTVSLATIKSQTDLKYSDLVNRVGQFMLSALYKGGGIFYSGIPVGSPDCPTGQFSDMNNTAISEAAVSMQALSLLALSFNADNFHLTDVLRDVAGYAADTGWNSADGVLDRREFPPDTGLVHNANQFSQNLIRSYFESALGDGPSDLKIYLRAYLGVQYDSLVKQATFPDGTPHFYEVDLRPESQLDREAQIVAITTLLGWRDVLSLHNG